MALHDRETVRDELDDCVFADRDLTRPVAKYRFPQDGTLPRDAFQLVSDELMLDGNARQNMATFCQTWEEPEALALMALAVNKNMIDRDEYPQSAEIERRCVHMMADLWNAPDSANTVGTSAIGSSEACMLAGMAAKRRWRAKRRAAGKSVDAPNMVCGPVQVVWHKFARYWDIEMREVPMAPGRYMMDAASMLERVDENTIMVVPTLGVTYTGAYEPVEEMAKALDQLQADTGLDIGIPTVTWRIREGEDPGYTLFDLADRLRNRGWQVPAYTLTGTASDIAVQRILVRLGVSQDMAALLLDDFRDAVAHFGRHPVTVSMTKEESGGFSHL